MRVALVTSLSVLALASAAQAATDQECQSLWKTLDVDANGTLEAGEDKRRYIAAVEKGTRLAKPGIVSRAEFLTYCKASIADVNTESPANTKDFGKGDLTPSKSALTEADVRKKLEANGFKNVRNLKLDAQGIWRGVADADVAGKQVAVDAQGDIMGQSNQQPPVKSDPTERSTANTPAPDKPWRNPDLVAGGGEGSSGGIALWLFLLIGNAAGLLLLNGVGGKTTAMQGVPGVKRVL